MQASKDICLGRLTRLLPLSLLRKSKSHNAPQGRALLGTALHSHGKDRSAPTSYHKDSGTAWNLWGMTAWVGARGLCLPQVWHPDVQMRAHFPIMGLPCKVSYFLCTYTGQTAFVTSSGGCCWVWVTLGIRLSSDMFQHEQDWILEGLGVLKILADGTFSVRTK